MSKCRAAYEAQYPYPYTNRLDYETWQVAWNSRGKVDAEICRAQATDPECPERATYCAEAIEKENE